MAFSYVNIGSGPNDGSGDPLRTAFNKINDNFTYVIGLGGGGGNVTANVDLTNYATITLVNSGLANVTGVNLSALNNALANVYAVNLTNLNNALANVNAVNLNALNNALANVYAVNLSNLNAALANLSLINLNNLNNALATVNFSLLSNVSNLVSAVTANTPSRVGIVSNLNTPGTTTGQAVLNNTDNGLYVWSGTAWTTASAAFTPNANSVAGVQVVSSLPVTGNFEGRQVLLNGALYIYSGGAFKSSTEVLTPTANSLTGIQIYTGASLPATTAADSGRTLFWTNQSNLYINVGGAWNNYNSYIQASSGNVTLGANSINSAALQNGIITADKIATGAIIAGKISAGAIGATEIAANAITANKLAANSVTAGAIAAGTITSEQIAAGNITASLIASNAIIAGKIAAGAISATEIAAGAIGANQIAANAIVSAKIAANAITAIQIAANAVYANAIQTNSITSAQIAANAITAVQLAANTVYAASLQARAITSDKIAANAITAVELAANSVYANALQANSVTAATIAANSITAVQIAANAIYANAIQANAIESNKIAANAITAVQLAANSVYANALQANSITTNALAANAITAKHIAANTITAAMIDSRGLTIRAADGTLLLGAGSGAQVVLANTLVVSDNTGTLRTLANVVTQSSSNAIQFIGSYASNAAADSAYGGSAPVNSVYKNTTDNKTYIKQSGGTWTTFLDNGSASFVGIVYRQQSTAPSAPSGGSFDFDTGLLTAPTGWSTTQPSSSTTPTYAATYIFRGASGSVAGGTWNTPFIIAVVGADGNSNLIAPIFRSAASQPATPTGGTYNFSTSTLTPPAGWSATQPTSTTTPTWVAYFTFSGSPSSTVTATTWSTPVITAQNGADGAAGARGNQKIAQAISGSTWSDSQADSAITSLGLTKVTRDEVTLYNTSVNFAETRFWTGSAWSTISAYINGGLVVNGTISANQLAADSVSASKIQAGAITTDKMSAGSINGDRIQAGTLSADTITSGTASTTDGSFALGTGSALTVGGVSYPAQATFTNTAAGKFAGIFDSCALGFTMVAANRSGATAAGAAAAFGKSTGTTYNNTWKSLTALGDCAAGIQSVQNASDGTLLTCFQGAVGTELSSSFLCGASGLVYRAAAYPRAFGSLGVWDGTNYIGAKINANHNASFPIIENDIAWCNSTCKIGMRSFTRYAGSTCCITSALLSVDAGSGALGRYGGAFATYNTSTPQGYVSLGAAGTNTGHSFYSVAGTIGPFTGSHDAYLDLDVTPEPGDIMIDVQVVAKKSVSDTITKVALSSAPNQKSVVGVFTHIIDQCNPNSMPTAVMITTQPGQSQELTNDSIDILTGETITETMTVSGGLPTFELDPQYSAVHLNSKYININSVGEGQVNVCGENGDIEIGDLITTSTIPGKGMKQSDDIIRNYTVGKAREAVTFSSPTEVKTIAVIYYCG